MHDCISEHNYPFHTHVPSVPPMLQAIFVIYDEHISLLIHLDPSVIHDGNDY